MALRRRSRSASSASAIAMEMPPSSCPVITRLSAAGSGGRALVTVTDATVARGGDTLAGSMGLRVDVSSGSSTAFAEAKVTRRLVGVGRDLRGALYDLPKQMLDDMNVELEYQLRQNLRDYLQVPQTAPAPPPVQQQDLAPPS